MGRRLDQLRERHRQALIVHIISTHVHKGCQGEGHRMGIFISINVWQGLLGVLMSTFVGLAELAPSGVPERDVGREPVHRRRVLNRDIGEPRIRPRVDRVIRVVIDGVCSMGILVNITSGLG